MAILRMKTNSFDKIELGTLQEKPQDKKPLIKKPKTVRFLRARTILLILLLCVVALSSFGVFLGMKAKKIYADAQQTYAQAKLAWDAVKKQDVFSAKEELTKTKEEIRRLNSDLNEIRFLNAFPMLSAYYQDAVHAVNAASFGVSASITAVDSLIPYADILGLKGEKSFVLGSAEERIKVAVKTMGKVVAKIDEIERDLLNAKAEIDRIDPRRYPAVSRLKQVRERFEKVRSIADESIVAISEAKPLIRLLPEILGEPTQKRYLVLFQNDKELRPTGGFITFYALFRVEQGIVHVDGASDIYDLDKSIGSHPPAPPVILKYLPRIYTFNIRDSNLSPDFIESMKMFNSLYEKAASRVKVDGIIALDTHVLAHVLDILGEVKAAGETFHTKNDPRCDCPQVVYLLELYADKPVGTTKENRKAIVGELLYALMEKALSSSPKLYWGKLFQQGLKDLQEKHILVYLYQNEAQGGIEALNWAGRIKESSGDYLHINDANFAGAKSNMYVKESVRVDYDISSQGEIVKKVTIDYKNPHPHSDCDLESGGLCLNATLRNYLRLYVPRGSILQDTKGSEVKVETKEELGKTVIEAFLTVKPLGKSQIVFVYKLPFKIEKNSSLPVLIQKQPGTEGAAYEVYMNGKIREQFVLKEDKALMLHGE